MGSEFSNRVLIVDDSPAIHSDFDKILAPVAESEVKLSAALHDLFVDSGQVEDRPDHTSIAFALSHAHQGQEAFEMIAEAEAANNPFALAFVDVRMPPGWDGVETISRVWAEHPRVEMVICTAFSDYSWEQMRPQLGCVCWQRISFCQGRKAGCSWNSKNL